MIDVEFKELASLVGAEAQVSDWILIDQDRVNTFADATNDHQWIHVDVERATQTIGGTIVHGYLILGLCPVSPPACSTSRARSTRSTTVPTGSASSPWSAPANGSG